MNKEKDGLIPELKHTLSAEPKAPNLLHQSGNVGRNLSRMRRFLIAALLVAVMILAVRVDFPVTGTGHVVPSPLLTVEALENGILETIAFKSGETVNKDDVIATLANDEILRDLEDSKLKMDIVHKKLLQQDRSRNYLRIVFNTYEELYRDNVIARAELEKAKLEYTHSQQEYDIYRDEMEGLRSKINYCQKAYRNMKVVSPIAGMILTPLENKLGTFVRMGDEICEVGDMENWLLELSINEKDIHNFKVGDKVTIRFPAFPHKPVPGNVVQVQHMVREKTRKVLVTENVVSVFIEPAKRDLAVKPQMTADVKIHCGKIRFRWQE
jgi:multidrug resistance efflux pump